MTAGEGYRHTQFGNFHHLFYVLALVTFGAAFALREHPAAIGLLIGTIIFLFAGAFARQLTIRDDGDSLILEFGLTTLFRKRFRYTDITSVEPGRTKVIDGWGIHYIIGRGWTYNIWGFDCVKLTLGKKVVRIGTDDVAVLTEFLQKKIGQ